MSTTSPSLDAPRALATRLRRPRAASADARWVRPALAALLVATAVGYLWDLSASGNANSFYAAAVLAATKSWKAFFFGSLDSSSFITVDKPPASLWVMALSGRIFGFSSWSMLAPQALEGVAAVALLYGSVKRWFGPAAGLAAGAVLALTPVAALMFRFNNPDALLVALLVASAYTLTRALEGARTRWMLATGALLGFAFLTKMGQALLVVPGFGIAYLLAAPTGLGRRIAGALAGLAALIVSCGWWIAIVALLPAGSRPFIDGSPDNNIFNLIFGYNGFSRLFGSGGAGGGGGANFSGASGTLRLFNDLMGAQASWLLPAAAVALVGGLWVTRRAPRGDRSRAALIVWGGWLLVTAAVFSYSQGVIHTYYTVALAPAIAALVAIGGQMLWQRRDGRLARAVAAAVVVLTAWWSYELLDRAPGWQPWLRPLVLCAAALAVVGLLAAPSAGRCARAVALAAVAAATIAMLAGPAAYTIETIGTAHTGSTPSAGPATLTSAAGPGGAAGVGGAGPRGASGPASGGGAAAGGAPAELFGGRASGVSRAPGGTAATGGPPSGLGGGAGGTRAGGLGGGAVSVSAPLVRALESDATGYRWVAATDGSQNAASYELATDGGPVMAIGGFNGNGGDLSLAQFIRYVRAGDIHYFIASGGGGGVGGPGSSSASSIASWVESHYTATTIGGVTVYDLARAAS